MNEDTLDDEIKIFSVDVEVELEDPNEFIEVKVKRNVVKLLFEGTFEENTEEILENLGKFPEPEIEVEEFTFHKHDANVSKLEPEVETSLVETPLDDNLDIDESQDILGNEANDKNQTYTRVTVPKDLCCGVKKTAIAVNTRNISAEFKTNVKAEGYEDPENTGLETLKLKLVAKLEKLIHIRKVENHLDNAIMIDKPGFDMEHYYCVLAKVLVIIAVTKPMDMRASYSLLKNEMTRLDINKKPWRPGEMLCLLFYSALMFVLMVQLLCVHYLLYNLSKDYNVVDIVAYNKTSLESEDCEVELLYPKLSLFVLLPNTTNRDLDEVKDNMQVDQTASADTLMVADLAQSGRGIFSR